MYHRDEPVPDTAWFKAACLLPEGRRAGPDVQLWRWSAATRPAAAGSKRRSCTSTAATGAATRYRWNDEQTDATLVPAAGEDVELTVKDAKAPGGVAEADVALPEPDRVPAVPQPVGRRGTRLHRGAAPATRVSRIGAADELTTDCSTWTSSQLGQDRQPADKPAKPLVNPHDTGADLDARARSYLHVNCAHCHQFGAGGSVNIDLRFDTAAGRDAGSGCQPVQGTFGIPDARILAPGDPYRSVLYYRMAKQGRGRMPHIGSELVDEAGVRLIGDWIRQLPPKIGRA